MATPARLFRADITPLPTPTSRVLIPLHPFPVMIRQFRNDTMASSSSVSLENPSKCSTFDATQTCSSKGDYGKCVSRSGEEYCRCNNGPQYLNCVSSAIATSSCSGIVGDFDEFERSWLLGSCSAPPSSVMVELPQPSSVPLTLAPVTVTVPPSPITDLPPAVVTVSYQPSSGGKLLEGDCSSTSFSVINAGDMMFYAPIVGCNAARPECCPWVVTGSAVAGAAAGTTAGPNNADIHRVAVEAGKFPIPENGLCCPNGYFKFTRQMASQTPCFSSLAAAASPPVITVGAPGVPTESGVPTSALVNIALAMSYEVEPEPPASSGGLSQGAVIGIGIGAGIAGILVLALIACLVVRYRRKKQHRLQPIPQTVQDNPFSDAPMVGAAGGGVVDPNHGPGAQGMTYKSGYHAPPGSPPPPSPQSALGGHNSYAATVSSSGRYTPKVVSKFSELPDVNDPPAVHHAQYAGSGGYGDGRDYGQGGYGATVGHSRGYSDGSMGHSRGYSDGQAGQWTHGTSQGWQQR